jgi:hypothetical protein
MKRAVLRLLGVGMLFAVRLFAWGAGHPAPAWSDNSCSLSTLKGTYMYECAGVQGSAQTHFAFAGKEQFHGDGTLNGVNTYADKDNVLHHVSYTGTYRLTRTAPAATSQRMRMGSCRTWICTSRAMAPS